jgi:toxin ParE1/3/4
VTARRYALLPAAERDLDDILAWTGRQFGVHQRTRYAALIRSAVERLRADPTRPGSMDRGDIEAGLRSYSISLAAGRQSAGAHVLLYLWDANSILVVRILHRAMDPRRHLAAPGDTP